MVTRNGIKLRMVFIAALFLMVLLIFTVPTFSKVYGYSHSDEIESIDSVYFEEGNVVCVNFDCVVKGNVTRTQTIHTDSFYVLKFGDEQFVYVRIPTRDYTFWNGANFFEMPAEAVGFKAEKPLKFIGVVRKTDDILRKELESKIDHMWLKSSEMINSKENSKLDYYLELLIINNEKMYLQLEIAVHIILIILFVLTVKRYKRFLWEEAVEEEKIQTI